MSLTTVHTLLKIDTKFIEEKRKKESSNTTQAQHEDTLIKSWVVEREASTRKETNEFPRRQGTWRQRVPSPCFYVLPNAPSVWIPQTTPWLPQILPKCHWDDRCFCPLPYSAWRHVFCQSPKDMKIEKEAFLFSINFYYFRNYYYN